MSPITIVPSSFDLKVQAMISASIRTLDRIESPDANGLRFSISVVIGCREEADGVIPSSLLDNAETTILAKISKVGKPPKGSAMIQKKVVGRYGSTRKYDLLTILGTFALSQDRALQRQTLRLICLITARYNWQNDHLSVAQTDIARLWSVDPRTVKREMAAFRDRGWLVEKRAAARGRVTLYGLGMAKILEDTRAVWEKVGPDLVERLAPEPEAPAASINVIPFPQAAPEPDGSLWGEVARILHAEDASVFRAWFAGLRETGQGETLVLQAPGSFHANYIKTHLQRRLELALARVAPGLGVRIE